MSFLDASSYFPNIDKIQFEASLFKRQIIKNFAGKQRPIWKKNKKKRLTLKKFLHRKIPIRKFSRQATSAKLK